MFKIVVICQPHSVKEFFYGAFFTVVTLQTLKLMKFTDRVIRKWQRQRKILIRTLRSLLTCLKTVVYFNVNAKEPIHLLHATRMFVTWFVEHELLHVTKLLASRKSRLVDRTISHSLAICWTPLTKNLIILSGGKYSFISWILCNVPLWMFIRIVDNPMRALDPKRWTKKNKYLMNTRFSFWVRCFLLFRSGRVKVSRP